MGSQRGKHAEVVTVQLIAVEPIALVGVTLVVAAVAVASFAEGFVLQLVNYLEQVATSA